MGASDDLGDLLFMLVPLFVGAACAVLAMRMAETRGRNTLTWAVLGLLFPIVAVITLWRLPPLLRRRTPPT